MIHGCTTSDAAEQSSEHFRGPTSCGGKNKQVQPSKANSKAKENSIISQRFSLSDSGRLEAVCLRNFCDLPKNAHLKSLSSLAGQEY